MCTLFRHYFLTNLTFLEESLAVVYWLGSKILTTLYSIIVVSVHDIWALNIHCENNTSVSFITILKTHSECAPKYSFLHDFANFQHHADELT